MSEELYGKAMRALAKSEGHRSKMPDSGWKNGSSRSDKLESRRQVVDKLERSGMSYDQIAVLVGIKAARIKHDLYVARGAA